MCSRSPRLSPSYLRMLVLAGALALAGCQSQAKKELVPVQGKILVGDASPEGALITFHPDTSKGNTAGVMPMGKVRKDGAYELVTGESPGAPLGWYRVTLTRLTAPGAKAARINFRYTRLDSTPLSLEVVSAPRPGQYDLRLTN